jgi:hypothetical protein
LTDPFAETHHEAFDEHLNVSELEKQASAFCSRCKINGDLEEEFPSFKPLIERKIKEFTY